MGARTWPLPSRGQLQGQPGTNDGAADTPRPPARPDAKAWLFPVTLPVVRAGGLAPRTAFTRLVALPYTQAPEDPLKESTPGDTGTREDNKPIAIRRTLGLTLLSLMGPLLCFSFMHFGSFVHTKLAVYGALAESGAYALLSAAICVVLFSDIMGGSARAWVVIISRLFRKHGQETWLSETVGKAAQPLSRLVQAMLAFVALNLLCYSIPNSWAWRVPRLLKFCDLDGNGLLDGAEIESIFNRFTSKLLGCYAVLQIARFLSHAKVPPRHPIEENARFPLAVYLRGLWTLKSRPRRRVDDRQYTQFLVLRMIDISATLLIWLSVVFGWASILQVPLSAIAAAVAPLGIGGLAFSLAAKNLIGNIISGALIFVNRGFVEGDSIQSSDGKVSGVVVKVGLVNTKVMQHQGDAMIIPNSHLADNLIANHEERDFWLIDKAVPLYMSSFAGLREVVAAMDRALKEQVAAMAAPSCTTKPITVYEPPLCFFEGFGHQGATVRVRAYVDGNLSRHQFYNMRSEIMLKLNDIAFSFAGTGIGFEAHLFSGDGQGGHGSGH